VTTIPSVLVIDDDEAIRTFISMSLEDEGYAVNLAASGMAALGFLANHRATLILLDMRMPDMDGRAFASAYRQLPGPHAPIVVMTADRTTIDTTADMDVAGILAKPFDLIDLLNVIARLVG
jgi:CheY-like chemotaxis protein